MKWHLLLWFIWWLMGKVTFIVVVHLVAKVKVTFIVVVHLVAKGKVTFIVVVHLVANLIKWHLLLWFIWWLRVK